MSASLFQEPWRFDLVSAVRTLEKALGTEELRAGSQVELRGWPRMSFAPADVASASPPEAHGGYLELAFSLTGSTGVLPAYWTQALERSATASAPANSLSRLLGAINHQLALLYYEASVMGDPGLALERAHGQEGDGRDAVAECVLTCLGLCVPPGVPSSWVVRYAPLLAQAPSRTALEQMLGDLLDAPVSVVPHPARAGGHPQTPAEPEPDLRLVLGPLSRVQYETLLPGGPLLPRVVRLTRLFVGAEFDFDLELVLAAAERGDTVLGQARLDWTSFLGATGQGRGIVSPSACRAFVDGATPPAQPLPSRSSPAPTTVSASGLLD